MTELLRPSLSASRVFLCVEPVDFRKSIDGLSLIVEQHLGLSPFEAVLYVFINRKRDKIKILLWEKNGFILWYKRLEKQRFKWPTENTGNTVTLNGKELNWILDGFDLWKNQPHKSLNYRSVG
jgi:transposase